MKKPNETAQIRVLRDGEEHELNLTLRPVSKVIIYCSYVGYTYHWYFEFQENMRIHDLSIFFFFPSRFNYKMH